MRSVLRQRGDFELEYIVQDGGGCAETASQLEAFEIESRRAGNGSRVSMRAFIEEDEGMYSAINRGFSRATGDVFAWINSDDMYHPYALATVARIFDQFPDVHWITGIPNSYNRFGARVGYDTFPDAYPQGFVAAGYCDVNFIEHGLNWIQQESTFWRRSLWEQAGPLDEKLRYASDFLLWKSFANVTDLVKVYSFLGGFRVHDDQFTSDESNYRNELRDVRAPDGLRQLRSRLAECPGDHERYLSVDHAARQSLEREFGLQREQLCGRTIRWDFAREEWVLRWDLMF
jgi:glycosyltransferase involved in cell wall biosynthesis